MRCDGGERIARVVALASAMGGGQPSQRHRPGARARVRASLSPVARRPQPLSFRGERVRRSCCNSGNHGLSVFGVWIHMRIMLGLVFEGFR